MFDRTHARPGLRVALIALALCASQPASAAWQQDGVPVGAGVGRVQVFPIICEDGTGGAYVTWGEYVAGDDGNVYVQRLTSAGDIAPGWPASGRALSTRPNWQGPSHITPDGSGGAYVLWSTYENVALQFRLLRVLADGTSATGWPPEGLLLAAGSHGALDDLCADGQGGVYVAWTSTDFKVWVCHFTPDGQSAPGWDFAGRRLVASGPGQAAARLLPTADHGFLAAWLDGRGSAGVFALHLTPAGTPAIGWPADGVLLNTNPTARQQVEAVSDGVGGAYVSWFDGRASLYPEQYDFDIYAQHVLADGVVDPRWPATGLPIALVTGQYPMHIAEDDLGGALFMPAGDPGAFYTAIRIHPDATAASGWSPHADVVTPPPYNSGHQEILGDGAGGLYAFWNHENAALGYELRAQHLDASGQPSPGWPAAGRVVAGGGSTVHDWPSATSDGMGGAIVAYERGSLIFAQRVLADGPVPTRIAFLDAEIEPGLARLRWSASDASSVRATVQRRSNGESWADRGEASPQGESVLAFEDREATPGRYAYRLALSGAGGMEFTEEAWIEFPAAHTLALAGFVPNPAIGAPRARVHASRRGPAVVTRA